MRKIRWSELQTEQKNRLIKCSGWGVCKPGSRSTWNDQVPLETLLKIHSMWFGTYIGKMTHLYICSIYPESLVFYVQLKDIIVIKNQNKIKTLKVLQSL